MKMVAIRRLKAVMMRVAVELPVLVLMASIILEVFLMVYLWVAVSWGHYGELT